MPGATVNPMSTRVTFDDRRISSTTIPPDLPSNPNTITGGRVLQRLAVAVHEHARAYLPPDEDGEQIVSVSVGQDGDGGFTGDVALRDGHAVTFRLREPPRSHVGTDS